MITANLRADASSRFAANHQWGYFPSFSVGWRMSNERFMQNVGWISDLKLRAITGTLSNPEVDNYACPWIADIWHEGECGHRDEQGGQITPEFAEYHRGCVQDRSGAAARRILWLRDGRDLSESK